MSTESQIQTFRDTYAALRAEIGKMIVGHDAIVEGTLIALFAGGHVLLEGVPGLGKTLLVRTLSEVLELPFNRIQFTPDLMPADILGTNIVMETVGGRREFQFQRGPIFANLILADEINRATPKTQSAMLEAMQEKQVTAGGELRRLSEPFFVMATQNPIDQEGTYPLPEAQLDRFMFFIHVDYPSHDEERRIARETTGAPPPPLNKLISGEEVTRFQDLVQRVPVPDHIYDTAVSLVRRTRPRSEEAPEWMNKWVTWGAGPRAVQYLIRGAKAHAILHGSYLVRMEDLEAVSLPVLTHRILTNFQAQSEAVTSTFIVERLLEENRTEKQRA